MQNFKNISLLITRLQRSWGKVIFSEVCVNNSVHRGGMHGCLGGACMVALGGHGFIWGACVVLFGGPCMVLFGGGHVWFYLGGMCGFMWGACMVLFMGACVVLFVGACVVLFGGACVVLFGGHAWFYVGGHVHGFIRGVHDFIQGACLVLFRGGACVVFSVFSDTMRYSQWAGGTHPTGMHSCFYCSIKNQKTKYIFHKNAFQWDAYRPLVDHIPACTVQGVSAWGCFPGRDVCPGWGGVYPSM